MGVVKKTGVMVPRVSLVYERSQILARVQDDLNVERVYIQQKRNKLRGRLGRRPCPECLANGFKLMMQEWMLEQHTLNHRILRALKQEKEWIQELRKKYKDRIVKFKAGLKRGREQARINCSRKAKIRGEWLWQRTILKPTKLQRINIAWFTLKMGGPIWVVPDTVWSESTKIGPYNNALTRAWELCHNAIERMTFDSIDNVTYKEYKNKSKKVTLLVSGWLSVSDKKYIKEKCYVDVIIEKEVILNHILTFVQWSSK